MLKNSGCMIRNMRAKVSPILDKGKWKSVHVRRAASVRDLMRIRYEAYVEEHGEPEGEQSQAHSKSNDRSLPLWGGAAAAFLIVYLGINLNQKIKIFNILGFLEKVKPMPNRNKIDCMRHWQFLKNKPLP